MPWCVVGAFTATKKKKSRVEKQLREEERWKVVCGGAGEEEGRKEYLCINM
jgi:hypothetical protein